MLQPNVEIMMATAMSPTAAPGKMASSSTWRRDPTGACWMASRGASPVRHVGEQVEGNDDHVPKARESGMLRCGSFTSPAVKVMLFHASAEKSEPVCATHSATKMPNAVAADTPSAIGLTPAWLPEVPEVRRDGLGIPADESGRRRMSATRTPVFVVVKTF